MINEMYVVGDVYRLFVKKFVDDLNAACFRVHIRSPSLKDFEFPKERTAHVVVCLSEGIDFTLLQSLARIQKQQNMFLYIVGSVPMTAEEQSILENTPSIQFPSYSLDIKKLFEVMENNDILKKRILVVDDEPIMLRSIKVWLGNDFDVSLVPSGEQALKFLDMHPVDLMLLDYKMPLMDGPEVLKKIREDFKFKDTPVMFLTAKNDRESVMSVMALKPAGYILKSKQPAEIRQAVVDFFKNRIVVMD